MKLGLEQNPHFSDNVENGNCPHCRSEGSLVFSSKELEVDDEGMELVPVEGLICSNCSEIFLSLDESARFLNIKARYDGVDTYYGVHDGDITEGRLH